MKTLKKISNNIPWSSFTQFCYQDWTLIAYVHACFKNNIITVTELININLNDKNLKN